MDHRIAEKENLYKLLRASETPEDFMHVLIKVNELHEVWFKDGYCYKGAEIAGHIDTCLLNVMERLPSSKWHKKAQFKLVLTFARSTHRRFNAGQRQHRENQMLAYQTATQIQI